MRDRSALSTVVTSAILLTAVTGLGGGIVTWSSGNLKAFETSLMSDSTNATNQINENLIVENVAFCNLCSQGVIGSTHAIINITLTNTGTLPLNVTKIQINSTTIKQYTNTAGQPITATPKVIFPHQSYTVSTVLPSNPPQMTWQSNRPDTITITTARGSIFTTQVAAP